MCVVESEIKVEIQTVVVGVIEEPDLIAKQDFDIGFLGVLLIGIKCECEQRYDDSNNCEYVRCRHVSTSWSDRIAHKMACVSPSLDHIPRISLVDEFPLFRVN